MSFPSPSSMPDDARAKVSALLQPVVMELLALAGVARKAHWNVRGMSFEELHELFGELYTLASDQADTLAEHVAMLGLTLEGDHVDVAERATLTGMPSSVTAGRDLARAVGDRITQVLVVVNAPKSALLALGDEDAQQLLIDVSIALSKLGWKILAHIG